MSKENRLIARVTDGFKKQIKIRATANDETIERIVRAAVKELLKQSDEKLKDVVQKNEGVRA